MNKPEGNKINGKGRRNERMKKTFKIILTLMCVLLFAETAHASFTITRRSSPVLYIDKDVSPEPTAMYAAYQIVSTTDIADAWVRIENFSSGFVGLAHHETGVVHLGAMTANVPMMAYFYLMGTETATAQTHDVTVYDRLPTAPGATTLATSAWTLNSVADTIQAANNVVTALVSGPSPPSLGGIVTISVSGDTGTLGNAPGPNGPLVFTPAAFNHWRADAYQLLGATVTFSNGNTGTYDDQLYFASLANGSDTHYEIVYTFRAIAVTMDPTPVSPVGYFASGTQMKHTNLTSGAYAGAGLAPIQPASNTLTLAKTVSASSVPNSGGVVIYTLRVTNSSASATGYLDFIRDTLPTSPASASYVNGSSYFNGVPVGDPVVSGANLTWYSLFSVPPSSFRDLTFQATLPATSGTYTNIASGYVGQSTAIDTTILTIDSVPASASTIVLAPPVLSKGFMPTSIPPGGNATLTFTVTNPNSTVAVSGVTFSDVLPTSPAAMTVASASTTNTCGGTLTDNAGNPLVAGGASIKLAGGSIPAGGACSVTVSVTAGIPGNYNNTTGAVSSSNAGTGATASAMLTVSTKPSISVSFSPASIASGATTTLSYTLSNNIASPLTAVTFTDPFPNSPGAMTVASPVVVANTCGGTMTDDTGGILVAGSTGIQLSNGNIAASGTCTVTVAVTASVQGAYSNSSQGVSSNESGAAGADSNSAVLSVVAPPLISMTFSPGVVAISAPSALTFTLTNPNNTGGPLTAVGFTDVLPTSPGAMTLYSATTMNTCGGILTDNAGAALAAGSASIKLAGASIAAGENCTITVSVKAPAVGTYDNSTGAVASAEGGSGGTGAASLIVDYQPTFTKSFASSPIIAGGNTNLTFTITNNSSGAMTNVTFTDVFPEFPCQMSISSTTTTNTCGGSLTDNAGGAIAVGSLGIKLTNGNIPLGGSCTITVAVKTTGGGRFTNTTTPLTSSAPPANPATATLNVFSLNKLFGQNPILPTGTSTLLLTVTNQDPDSPITGVTFSDIFPTTPAQMSLATAAFSNTCGGSLTDNAGSALAIGSTSLKLTGGSVGPNGNCLIQTTVKANTATEGSYTNTAGVNSTDLLVLTLSPTVTLSFSTSPISPGGTSTLTMIVTNNTNLGALSNVSFTNDFPAGMVVSPVPSLTNTCGGTISGGTAGDGYLNLSGGSIATGAASTCTITVSVTAATGGSYADTTSGVSSTETPVAGPASNTATLLVQMPAPGVVKSFNPASAALGVQSQMTIAFTNPNASNITGVAFVDTYPAGMMNIASGTVLESNTCGGLVTAANSGTSLSFTGGVILPAGCSITVNVVGTAIGNQVNNTGAISSTNAEINSGATGTLAVVEHAVLTKIFSPNTVSTGQTSVLMFTITNGSGNPAQSGLAFTDTLVSGVTVTGAPVSPQCGGTVTYPAPDTISFSGGTLGSGQASCIITVDVTSSAEGSYTNDDANISGLASGLTADTASATLTVVQLPNIIVLKSVSTYSDPFNSTTNPKAIPGAIVQYTMLVTNTGPGTAQSVAVIDPIPANTELFANDIGLVGSGPVAFSDGAVASGLAYSFGDLSDLFDDLSFSNDGGGTWNYVPIPNADGFDSAVTNIRISPSGTFNGASGGNNPSFSLIFRVRVK